jgi:hypothetical protein
MMRSARDEHQKTSEENYLLQKKKREKDILKASQKKIAPAFFVLHHPGRPFLKPSGLSLAWGSESAFLQPGCVHAEMVVINLCRMCHGKNVSERLEDPRN